ncbi:hypothetical protein NQ314_006743 [Rhamnusium bicolor]|uniref:CCDC66 domain-containing protein n=1 Tax=Rhamnusium bicolor TaxID=1586634 RepID=A0AAV8YYK8_9CUCU|nr:hypothetical protein NQ314_006743 [Rhamnusium bicolor]
MSTFCRSMSLVERKKLQWAKEREELASLCAPWGPPDQNIEQSLGSSIHMIGMREKKELGGETSGYGSDNPNQTPDLVRSNWHQSGYESSSSRDDRPKWGDKGVGVGKFWQPKEEPFNENQMNEPPNWVKRGLQDGEIVVSNTSPAESPEQRYDEPERPCTGSSYSHHRNTYIRGQNIPIDSVELAERERRRQVAMVHQEAIRLQLEERERMRREERERRIQEEHEEELRIEREQEIERQRKENELRKMREKQERERKRKEAIQEAIELAQKAAQLEKTRRINKQTSNHDKNITENITEKDKMSGSELNESNKKSEIIIDSETKDEKKSNNCDQLNNTRNITPRNEILNNEINNNLEIKGKTIESPRSPKKNVIDNKPPTPPMPTSKENFNNQCYNNNNNYINNNVASTPLFTPRTDNLALVIQTPLDALQNVQYALLVPATPQNIPIAVPINVPQTDRSCNTSRTENRILTPTQYRIKNRGVCDSSTQTEDSDFGRTGTAEHKEKYVREKLTNLELTYDNRNRKERRSRSESVEERPKWGANRPPTRYLKQSEKDPLYQRRKLRQNMRDNKTYDKNSSDESQTATTPRSYRKKGYIEKRHSRALWRKNDQVFTRNIRMYQTEIVPLESDKDQIYYKARDCCCVCRCERHQGSGENIKFDILKIEHTSPRENMQYKSEIIESSERLPDCNDDSSSNILDKLSSLHNGLLLKQEQWENCPSTPSLSPHNRN